MSTIMLHCCICPTCNREAPGIMTNGVLSVPEHRQMTTGEICPGSGDAPVSLSSSAPSPIEVDRQTGLPTDGSYLRPGYDAISHFWDGYIQPRKVGN